MSKHQTSLEKIEKIERKKDEAVFLVCEFTKLGGEDQILRGSYRSGQGPSGTARLRPMAVPVPRG
ncbi:hypothetical protein ACVWZZ_005517 [Bradyrhizobium sp. LM6.10]